MVKLLVLLFALVLLGAGCAKENAPVNSQVEPRSLSGAPLPPSGTSLTTELIAEGDGAGSLVAEGSRLIASQERWETTWDGLRPKGDNRPVVDFDTNKVLIVARQVTSGGHALRVTETSVKGDRIKLNLNVVAPAENCVSAAVIQDLWVAVRVPYWANGAEVQEERTRSASC